MSCLTGNRFQTLKGSLQTWSGKDVIYAHARVSNPQRIATNAIFCFFTSRLLRVSNPQRIATNYALRYGLNRSEASFKPSKDRYKPDRRSKQRPEIGLFQTLKGSLQTPLLEGLFHGVLSVSNPQRIATNFITFFMSSTFLMKFQTLKGSLQTGSEERLYLRS